MSATRHAGIVMNFSAPPAAPEVYVQEYDFWPWGELLRAAERQIIASAPHGAHVADIMCGPGVLLARLQAQRPDLHLVGYDANPAYIEYGTREFPGLSLELCDVLQLRLPKPADIVVCTGGLHHLPFAAHAPFLQILAASTSASGYCLLGEEVLSPYESVVDRRLAAIELGAALLTDIVRRDAPVAVIDAAIAVMTGDLYVRGEYKLDFPRLRTLAEEQFTIAECSHIWPAAAEQYGDFLLLCKPRR